MDQPQDPAPSAQRPLSPSGEVQPWSANVPTDFALPTEGDAGSSRDPETHFDDSVRAQAAFEEATRVAESGGRDEAVREFLRASDLAEEAREWYLAAVACQRVGDMLQAIHAPGELGRAVRMHRRAVAAYERCGLFVEARRLSYRLMVLKVMRARELGVPWWTRAELAGYWLTAGFGYRPMRVVLTAILTVVAFGIAYWLTDGAVTSGLDPRPATLGESLYFSGITYATVGYGDFVPAPHARALALIEGALGIFTVSFFVVVLANRLRH